MLVWSDSDHFAFVDLAIKRNQIVFKVVNAEVDGLQRPGGSTTYPFESHRCRSELQTPPVEGHDTSQTVETVTLTDHLLDSLSMRSYSK
jgi:hypothetical protein